MLYVHEITFHIVMILIVRGACKDPESILDCHRRLYNHTVTKKDALGRSCWDTVTAVSCWGRCDSREVGTCIQDTSDFLS